MEDENHRPVGGAVVSAALPSRGASGVFVGGSRSLSMPVGEDGKASFRLQPNSVAGRLEIRVTASFQGQTASVTIAQTNAVIAVVGPAVAAGISAKVIAIIAVVGAAAAGGVVAATRSGSNGNNNGTTGPSATTVSAGVTRVGAP